jgi:hypothetical protein
MAAQGYIKNILKNPDGTTPTIENVNGLAFETNALLTANSSVSTGWINYNQYLSASVIIFSDVASATSGLTYEYSADNGVTILDLASVTFVTLNEFRVAIFPLGKGNAVRITYLNGTTNQTKFYLSVSLGLEISNSMGSVFTPININNIASITKTFLQIPDSNAQSAIYDFITRTGNSLNVNSTNNITGYNLESTQLLVKAKTDNLDVLQSTRASETTLSALNTKVTTTVNGIKVDGSSVTQPISAVSLPLPTGASTSALQSTIDTSINTLLKPASTLNKVSTLDTITNALPVGTNSIGQVTSNAGTNLNTSLLSLESTQTLIKSKTDNLDVLLSTRLKPSDTLTAVTTVGAVTAITNALPVGSNIIGKIGIDQTTQGTSNFVTNNTTQLAGNTIATNSGVNGVGVQRITLATDDSLITNIGTDNTSITQLNTGTGIRGWLSGIYKRLTDNIVNSTSSFTKITDGTNDLTIKPTLTAPLDVDTSAVVSLHPLGNIITTGATSYFESVQNKTTTQLASGAIFTGTIVSVLSYPQAIISVNSDQPFTLTIEQFSDLAGVYQLPSIVYTRLAGEDFNQPVTLSGSYVRIKLQNTGVATTTNLFLETWFGTISATPNLTNAGSLPVDIKTQSDYIIGQTTQTAIINNILPFTASANATDAGGYNSGTTTIVSTGTGGTFLFEGSNDNVTFEPLTVKRTTLTNGDILTTAITATASTLTYEYAVKYKYIRLRIVTAITGGSIRAFSRLSSNVFTTDVQRVANNQSTNFFVSAVQSGTWIENLGYNTPTIDVASAAITTSTTTGAITPTSGLSYQVSIPVTAVSGTTPVMNVRIEESNDTGTNWYSVYTFPNITATGNYISPKFNAKGNRIRYVQTLTGTTPSFTRSVQRMQSNEIVQIQGSIPVITNTTITTGGTSQTALVAKPNRNYLEIQNTSAGDLWINFSTNAGVNIGFKVSTGQSWSPIGGTCPESSVTIFGVTTGQTYAISEF